ncbi:hypothetical protein LguiB_017857 [Lonicera macranthoides]
METSPAPNLVHILRTGTSGLVVRSQPPCPRGGELLRLIHLSITKREKTKRRQQLLSGNSKKDIEEKGNDILHVLAENLKRLFCMQLPERPVTEECEDLNMRQRGKRQPSLEKISIHNGFNGVSD